MEAASAERLLSREEYFAEEERAARKHEYVAGQIYAMSGATSAHNIVALNLAMLLRQHVRGRPGGPGSCQVFMSDMKVRVESADAFYYPDVVMTCAEADRERDLYKAAPKLVIEVFSRSTESLDRGVKSERYRSLPSLEEYVLVDPRRPCVEIQRRVGELWILHGHYNLTHSAELTSAGLELALQDIYEEVDFPDPKELLEQMKRDVEAEDPDAK